MTTCECGRRMHSKTHTHCYVCRTVKPAGHAKDDAEPAQVVWVKDRRGVWRAVGVWEPSEPPTWHPRKVAT